jgi:hypothetical protein
VRQNTANPARPSEGFRHPSLTTKHLRSPIYKRSLNIGLQS